MKKIWNVVLLFLERNLVKLLGDVARAASKVVDYLENRRKDSAKKQIETELKKAEAKVDSACDKGDINGLLDAAEELKKAKQKEKELNK